MATPVAAALSQALEQNDKFFQQEREKLDAWAEDRILAAEQALQDTKLKLKGLKRQARTAQSMDEARRLQDDIRKWKASNAGNARRSWPWKTR